MRILVTWASKRGGTADIAHQIARTLEDRGHVVLEVAAREAPSPHGFDAVILGGALYANRWPASLRTYAARHVHELRRIPTWLFSSGPLDDSAETSELPPPREIRALMLRSGAIEHVTFGGRLERTATGTAAAAMAKEHAGDWRNPARIHAWVVEIAAELPTARPRPAEELHGHALHRLVEYGATGWALCTALMGLLLATTSTSAAITTHAIVAPIVFGLLAHRYHAADGARAPLVTALAWTAMVAIVDLLLVAPLVHGSLALAFGLPLALTFVATLGVGTLTTMLPFPKAHPAKPHPAT